MNVNVWGPELWSLLHGIGGLTKKSEQKKNFLNLFQNLKFLLPCIHCRNSYKEFFDIQELIRFLKNKQSIEYVYQLHNDVNDKLELQKLEKLFNSVSLHSEQKRQIFENRLILSTRPSIEIVKKRFNLSNKKPFCEETVWKVLFSFVILIDIDEEDPRIRRLALSDFIQHLGIFLSFTEHYFLLSKKLLNIQMPANEYDSQAGFYAIYMANDNFKESFEEMWNLYVRNLPARSCDNLRCI